MPIARVGSKVCHFAHIPKCGGSSVVAYLNGIGARVAFHDHKFLANPAPHPWSISSPQHVDGYSLSRLFPSKFFDFSFAVVRNPLSRFKSAFSFQMLIEKKIERGVNINDFVQNDLEDAADSMGAFDNHFRTQVSFLMPENSYKILKLENGLEHVKEYLDMNFFGTPVALNIKHRNKGRKQKQELILNKKSQEIIRNVYHCDFEEFQYDFIFAS